MTILVSSLNAVCWWWPGCKKIGLHFTETVSYLFPLETNCFQVPGLDQLVWIMGVLPSLIQGGSLLTLHVCQLGHTTSKKHYDNNTIVDSLTLLQVCDCKHLQSHMYDMFPQISKLGRGKNLYSGPIIGHFNSVWRSIFFFQSQLMAWWSSSMINNKCWFSTQISVFFICFWINWIDSELTPTRAYTHYPNFKVLYNMQAALLLSREVSHFLKNYMFTFGPHWCANEPQSKM